MRTSGLWVLILALLALPVAAQPQPAPSCGAAAVGSSSIEGLKGTETYRPLEAEQRLFYGLSGLGDEPLEIRYLVKGALHLTEAVDLSAVKLPQIYSKGRELLPWESTPELQDLLEGERMIELLAMRPDLVRQLHQLSRDGARIEIRVLQAGRRIETLSFKELVRRSAELRNRQVVPVAVVSTVRGAGDRGAPRRDVIAKEYLPDCGDCTPTTPCETECGWEPGKGGPVTCGEYGVCENAGCSCEVYTEYWTDWYLNRFYPASPASYDCLYSRYGGSTWHQWYVKEYRRDRIRHSTICPNCPACTGCYVQEQVVSYEYAYGACWYDTYGFCGFGRLPWCSELCAVYYNTPCN